MSSSVDDYLDDLSDYDVDLSDYGLNDEDLDWSSYGLDGDDIDYSDYFDYLPTPTSSSSYPTSTSYDWLSGDSGGGGGDDDDDDGDNDTPISSDLDMNLDGTPPSGDSSGNVPPSLGGLGAFGSDYSGQQTSDSCVSEVAFKTTGPKVDLAFDVVFLVLFLGLAVFTILRLLKINKNGGGMVKWVLFPVSLFFAILYLFLDMITLILSECLIMRYDKYQQAQTAVEWFNRLSVFLLIVAILLPICLKLQRGGSFRTLTLFAHSAWLALTGIFLLVSLALYTRISDALFRTGDNLKPNFLRASRDVSMVYHVFLFIAALLAVANMGFALLRKANLRKGITLLTIPILALSILILTLILLGGFADINYGDAGRSAKYYEQSGDAQVFLSRLFYAVALVSALFIAGANTASEDAAQPASSMAQTPKPAEYYQPQPHPQPATTAPVPAPAPAQH
ncbi:hypothetical protein BDW75DRAFT_247693 [Aspergillus navahoensis]